MSHAQFRAHEICFETLPDEELLKLFAEHRGEAAAGGLPVQRQGSWGWVKTV